MEVYSRQVHILLRFGNFCNLDTAHRPLGAVLADASALAS